MKEKLEIFGYKYFVAKMYIYCYRYKFYTIPIGIYRYLCVPI